MRLIDADALHEALMTKQKWVVRCGDKHNEGYTYDQVHFAIDEAPTIEAVSIDDYRSMENTCYKLQKALYDMADRKTDNSSEKPNNCEHITEDGVTCAKYPACDDCLDNPLNKVKGSKRLLKGKTEPTGYNLSPVDKDINVRSKTEPQTDGILFKGNLKEGEYKLIKTTNGWVLEGNDIAYCGEPQTEVKEKCDRPQMDIGIGCSRCGVRFGCIDRDMPHAVYCNSYGKITDEP